VWYSLAAMIALILSVVLSVVPTAPPIPRQTSGGTANTSRRIQKNSSNNESKSTPSQPPINAGDTPSHSDRGDEQSTDNTEHPITVGKLPPVTIHRDWIDRGIWIFNAFLVIVGFLQWQVLRRQAKLMKIHADHLEKLAAAARDNASAASLNAQSLINSDRPWVGMSQEIILLKKQSTKPGRYEFTVGYTVKNFGVSPALNTVVSFGITIGDVNNYDLVKSKVAEARRQGENIIKMTGDLLLPTAEKNDTCLFGESERPNKIVIPGCIVYRSIDGAVHHTELSYWIDFSEGDKAVFRSSWFQSAD
jgi:hypothetical protein